MDRYIGLDAHVSSCTLGMVGPSGKRLGLHVVETNAKALIEVLHSIPGGTALLSRPEPNDLKHFFGRNGNHSP